MCGRPFELICLLLFVSCAKASTANDCKSTVCTNESNDILNYMDAKVNPCENFYDFVCGKFINNTVLPKDKSADLSFFNLADKLREQIRDALMEKSQPNESNTTKLAKDFLNICNNEKSLNAAGIAPMLEYFDKYGGWPVIKGENEWKEDDWDWLKVKQQLLNDGFVDNIILSFKIQPTYADTSKRGIFIDHPEFGESEKFLVQGENNARVKQYYNFMVDLAVIYGADRKIAESEMHDVLEFETELATNIGKRSSLKSGTFNIASLQNKFHVLNWRDFINWNLMNTTSIKDDDVITIPHIEYLRKLPDTLSNTEKRTIANYIGMRLAMFSSDLLNDVLHERQQQYEKEKTGTLTPDPRLTECIKKTQKSLPIPTAAIYIRKYFDKNSKDEAMKLAKNIKNEFIEILTKVPWMDETTRKSALEKANAIVLNIGYPDELSNDQKLDEYYHGLKLPNSLLHSMLNIQKFAKDKEISDFRKPIVKSDWREIAPKVTEVDAFYYPAMNGIFMSAGILQEHFFKANRPSYMNYGTIGSFIGHEITHGFDNDGRQRDAKGNIFNWWDKDTLKKFDSKAQCFVEKYSQYKHPTLDLKVNGQNTLGENIADIGGFKAAHGAYQQFVQKNGPEPLLPNLNYTQNQIFWISAAHTWCAVTRPEFDTNQYTTDIHTPFRHRINGAFSSLSQFANDFKCSSNSSPMNPTKKCEVW